MASSIPYAVNNFIALMTTIFTNDGHPEYQVWFGKVQPMYSAPITLEIMGVDAGDQRPAELGINYKREEEYIIECCLVSYQGDQDFLSRMVEVFAVWDLVTSGIANDPSLTGIPNTSQNSFPASTGGFGHSAVRFAQIRNMNFYGKPTSAGKSVGCITFDIHCEARIESLT